MLVAFNRLLGRLPVCGLSCHAGANALDNYEQALLE